MDAPLKEKEEIKQTAKKSGILKVFILVLLCVFIIMFTPLIGVMISFIPAPWVKGLIDPYYRQITLENNESKLHEPLKYDQNAPYPVLSRNSSVCFQFYSTRQQENLNYIDAERIKNATKGQEIAEIIVTDADKKQYPLKDVSLYQDTETKGEHKGKEYSVICQRIGRESTIPPKEVTAIYIRPLSPFRPARTYWLTQIDWSAGAIQ